MREHALSDPFFALESRKGLSVVRDVRKSNAGRTRAFKGECILE